MSSRARVVRRFARACQRGGAIVASLVVLALVACRRPEAPRGDAGAGRSARPLALSVAGCVSVVETSSDAGTSRVCEVSPATTLVVSALADGGAAPVILVRSGVLEAGRGASVRVTVPASAPALEVETLGEASPRVATLALRLAAPDPVFVEDARRRRASGDLAGARDALSPHVDEAAPRVRALALGLLARVELASGDAERAFPLFRRAIEADRAAGRVSDASDDSFALAFALHQRSQRYGEARAVLDGVASLASSYPEGAARLPYYRGILAGETGDHRSALTLLRDAEEKARAVGLDRLARNAASARAVEMQALGRAAASLDGLRRLAALPDLAPCERAEIENNLGWGSLLAGRLAEARAPLERALAVTGCADAYVKSFAYGNLARLAVVTGDAAAARDALAKARESVREPRGTERLSWLELEARIDLDHGDARRALARADELVARARASFLRTPEASGLVVRAQALAKLGRLDEAIATAESADALVDEAILSAPLGEGRSSLATMLSAAAELGVDLLVRRGREGDALRLAERSHGRVLASVARSLRIEGLAGDARARWDASIDAYKKTRAELDREAEHDWELPADALARVRTARADRERALGAALDRAMALVAGGDAERKIETDAGEADLADGAATLALHPGRGGWVALLRRSGKPVTSAPVPAPSADRATIGRALGALFGGALPASLHVIAYGAYRSVDLQTSVLAEGAPLGLRTAIDFPVGLGRSRAARAGSQASVVVGDPTSDLPEALAEAKEVTAILAPRGPVTVALRAEARRPELLALLARSDLFHYAGHGVFAGTDGFDSALPLAGGGALTVGDILATSPLPRTVVLAGCEAGRDAEGGAEGLGLAQAFVAGGAEAVLAPTRKVDDIFAHRFAVLVARELASGRALPEAARLAASAIRTVDPSLDWAAFRVLTR